MGTGMPSTHGGVAGRGSVGVLGTGTRSSNGGESGHWYEGVMGTGTPSSIGGVAGGGYGGVMGTDAMSFSCTQMFQTTRIAHVTLLTQSMVCLAPQMRRYTHIIENAPDLS